MDKNVKPTPVPWEACERGDYGDYDGNCVVILGDDERVAVVFDDANAAHIVRCVDAHDKLVAALQSMIQDEGYADDRADAECELCDGVGEVNLLDRASVECPWCVARDISARARAALSQLSPSTTTGTTTGGDD